LRQRESAICLFDTALLRWQACLDRAVLVRANLKGVKLGEMPSFAGMQEPVSAALRPALCAPCPLSRCGSLAIHPQVINVVVTPDEKFVFAGCRESRILQWCVACLCAIVQARAVLVVPALPSYRWPDSCAPPQVDGVRRARAHAARS
jgi:hypothetical protein